MRYDIWNLGSSSEGNCFIVKHKDYKTGLMLECGLSYNQLKKRWRETAGAPFPEEVLISHEHLDHCRAWEKLYGFGCDIIASHGTSRALHNNAESPVIRQSVHSCIKRLNQGEWQTMAPKKNSCYCFMPLLAHHDAAEPTMFLIRAVGSKDVLLFAIDTGVIPYDFKNFNVTDILIECNYSESDISPDMDPIRMERVRNTHMSLETLTDFFENQKFPNLQQITLCHLSQSNCDPMKAKETIMAATGVPVRVCAAKGGFIGN